MGFKGVRLIIKSYKMSKNVNSHQGRNDYGHCDREDEQRYSQLVEECKAREHISCCKTRAFQKIERSQSYKCDQSRRCMGQECCTEKYFKKTSTT